MLACTACDQKPCGCVCVAVRARLRQCRHEPKKSLGLGGGQVWGRVPALLLPGLVASVG